MIARWEDKAALVAANRLHRWATVLMTVLTVIVILAAIGGAVLLVVGIKDSDDPQTAYGIGFIAGAGISLLPTVVFGSWAQAYATDLRARASRAIQTDALIDDEDDVPKSAIRRRPRVGRL